MTALTRREFVQNAAVAALAAAAAPLAGRAATPATPANPFKRSGPARLRLSLAAYSFRDSFPTMRGKANAKAPTSGAAMDMFKFIDYCAEHGCDGAELTSYFFSDESDALMLALRRHAYLRGLPISGTAVGNNFSHPKGAARDEQIAYTKKWIDKASLLGTSHLRVFAGMAPKDFPRAEADKMVVATLQEVAAYAGQRGVFLGLENHDSIRTAAALLPMVQAINSPWVGVNLDSGNFHGTDTYEDFAACVPYSVNVQLKAEVGHRAGGKVPADYKRFIQILRDGGYQGWVVLEYESSNPAREVPKHLEQLRRLIDG